MKRRFKKWMGRFDARDPDPPEDFHDDFDWAAFDHEGEALARELKKVVGPETYVEYHPGREIR